MSQRMLQNKLSNHVDKLHKCWVKLNNGSKDIAFGLSYTLGN